MLPSSRATSSNPTLSDTPKKKTTMAISTWALLCLIESQRELIEKALRTQSITVRVLILAS